MGAAKMRKGRERRVVTRTAIVMAVATVATAMVALGGLFLAFADVTWG